MHWKTRWVLPLALTIIIGMCVVVTADEGVHRTWITIGEPGYETGATCDACWDQLISVELHRNYRQVTAMWKPESDCIDWDTFQENVLPLIAEELSLGAARFGAMLDTIYEMRLVMEQAGTLALWEQTSGDVAGWPIFPLEFPWPWPWPNCIFFSYALSVGGIAENAVTEIVAHSSFSELAASQPEVLAAILSEAILEAADLVSAPAARSTVERISTNVIPKLLTLLATDTELLASAQTMLEGWGEDSESPLMVPVMIPCDDPFDSERYEIRDWMDYVQTAAAVIAAGAAIAACCM